LKLPYVMSSSRKWAGRLFQTRGPPGDSEAPSPNVLGRRGTAWYGSTEPREVYYSVNTPVIC